MVDTNKLYRCPRCGNDQNMYVEVRTWTRLASDGGIDGHAYADYDWQDEYPCECNTCTFEGTVADFRINKDR